MTQVFGETIDLSDFLEEKVEGRNIRPADYWAEPLENYFYGDNIVKGAMLPWEKTHANIRLRGGEVSLWMGQNGHGKSLITSLVSLNLCAQGFKVCVASMEMKPPATLARMARQATGTNLPSKSSLCEFNEWTSGLLWLYDKRGQLDWQTMIAVIKYGVHHFGIQHFFVDSLMKCVKGEDDYNGQKDFTNALCSAAQDLDIHIHLIHHVKKPSEGESKVPGKYDAKGSGSIVDQVDNVFGIWRNKNKEDDRREFGRTDETKVDQLVICDKQRNGEWEGKVGLWYDPASFQYRSDYEDLRRIKYF